MPRPRDEDIDTSPHDPFRSHEGKKKRRQQIEELIKAGLSDMRIAVRLGCSWIEVKQLRTGNKLNESLLGGYDD